MKLTNEQIVKLIADAFRVGRAEGMEIGQKDGYADGLLDGDAEGYERGWEEGWDKGYDAAEKDAEDADDEEEDEEEDSDDEKDDYSCKCTQCTYPREYNMGWEDGFNDSGVDPDMGSNEAYMKGFLNGRDERENDDEDPE